MICVTQSYRHILWFPFDGKILANACITMVEGGIGLTCAKTGHASTCPGAYSVGLVFTYACAYGM